MTIYLPLLFFVIIVSGFLLGASYFKRFFLISLLMAIIMLFTTLSNFAPSFIAPSVITSVSFYITAVFAVIITYPLIVYPQTSITNPIVISLQKLCMFLIYTIVMVYCFYSLNYELQSLIWGSGYEQSNILVNILIGVVLYLVLMLLPITLYYYFSNYLILIGILGLFVALMFSQISKFDLTLKMNYDIFNVPEFLLIDISTAIFLPLAVTIINNINKLDYYSKFVFNDIITSTNQTYTTNRKTKFIKTITFLSLPILFFGLIDYVFGYLQFSNMYSVVFYSMLALSVVGFSMMKYGMYDLVTSTKELACSNRLISSISTNTLKLLVPGLAIALVYVIGYDTFINIFVNYYFVIVFDIGFILIPICYSNAPKFFKVLATIITIMPIALLILKYLFTIPLTN